MAEQMLENVKVLIGGYDVTGKTNSVTINHTAEMLDRTVFGNSFRRRLAGLTDFDLSVAGYWGSTDVDNDAFSRIASSARVLSIMPATAEGGVAFLANGVFSEYSPAGTIGDLFAYDIAAVGTPAASSTPGSLYQGKTLCARGASTSEGATSCTGMSLGALSTLTTSQRLYAAFHMVNDVTTKMSSGGVQGDIVASCSSGLAVGTTLLATTMITIARTSATVGAWQSTKIPSTSREFYGFIGKTTSTGGGTYLKFFVNAAIK